MDSNILTQELVRSYYDARRHKRNTSSQLHFEYDFEHNLEILSQEIASHQYKLLPSSCFIVPYPVKREVFAANFRDRIVHHFLFNALAPLIEQTLIADCYSCRKGKGTLYGINRLHQHIRSCTRNFTQQAYILKLDIQGYFMNINRDHLFHIVEGIMEKFADRKAPCTRKWKERIDYPLMLELLKVVIYSDPTDQCIFRSPISDWQNLPKNKSLFGTPEGYGLPIGNLTSQLFSNIYLSGFDNFCKHTLRLKHYGRYVDDFYVVHNDKEYLKHLIEVLKNKLENQYQLTLHPKKIYLQDVNKGVTFLGAKIKGASVMPGERARKGLRKTIAQYNYSKFSTYKALDKFTEQANSYIGGIVHVNSFNFRKKWIEKIHPKGVHLISYDPSRYHKIKTTHLLRTPPRTDLEAIFNSR